MANTPDVTECAACRRQGDARLPIDPWRSLAVHFGMLLGVDDFQTVDAYHRGKMWLHSAWLHREGVVWGLRPWVVEAQGELRLEPGLAIDACGRELHLDRPTCIDLGKWFSKRAEELLRKLAAADDADPSGSGFGLLETADGVQLDAHVRMRFVGCLDRQVPALAEPCDGAGRTTAYSRIYETVEIELVPGLPTREGPVYPRLRRLFGLDDPNADAEVLAARTAILALPLADQPTALEQAFRRFAALDAADLAPAKLPDSTRTLLPAIDPAWFVLAELGGLALHRTGDGWAFASLTKLDWHSRPTHVATRPLEDLIAATLAGSLGSAGSSGSPVGGGAGPRVLRSSVEITDTDLQFASDHPLDPASVGDQIELAVFVSGVGWKVLEITDVRMLDNDKRVRAKHDAPPRVVAPGAALVLRLRVDGTSATPVLGKSGWPLAGADDDPSTANHAGRDFTHMQRRGA